MNWCWPFVTIVRITSFCFRLTLSLGVSRQPRQSCQILRIQTPIPWLCVNTFRELLLRISSSWKMTVFLRFPCLTKTKSVTLLRLLLLWKSWGNTPILFWLTKTRAKSSSLSSMSVSPKIVTVLFCLALPTLLRQRQMLGILSIFQTKISLNSYRRRICQLKTFKNSSKGWGVIRLMNYQLY